MASFVVWMLLLLLGFGLVAHGFGNWFSPPVDNLAQAMFIAGSALATVSLSGIEAHKPAVGRDRRRLARSARGPDGPGADF